MKFDIVTFGSAVIDTFISTKVKERGKFFNYHLGDKILIDDLKFDVGGGATNTAVAFSRLGFHSACICNVGSTEGSDVILKTMKRENVAILNTHHHGETGYSVILDSHKSDRTILTYKGGNNDVSLKDIPKFESNWLYLTSVLGKSLKTQVELAKSMKKNGTKVAFNPSSYLIDNENIKDVMKITDVLIINLQEARKIADKYVKNKHLDGLSKLGPNTIVITDSDREVICYSDGKKYVKKPKKVKAIELTGAGDAFAAGFIAGKMLSWPVEKSLELGFKESAQVIQHMGAKSGLLRKRLKK